MKFKLSSILYVVVPIFLILLVIVFLKLSIYRPNFDLGSLISYESKYLNFNENRSYIFMEPKESLEISTGVIFYPGAMVDEKSYIPLLSELSKDGYGVYIVKSIFKLPILNQNAAENIMGEGRFNNYILIGHSLGGTALLKYFSKGNESSQKVKDIILLGAYSDGSHVFDNRAKFLSIVGENDKVINMEKYSSDKKNLPGDTRYLTIEGGNHAYYGNYGKQRNDGEASISIESQQYFVLNEIKKFVSESN